MAIASSGNISFDNIQTEFGGSNPIGINEYYAGGSYVPAGTTGTNGAVPSSGTIAVSNFYGTSASLGYVENFFSTYLYVGNSGSQAIVNGINMYDYGGLIWIKDRDTTYSGKFVGSGLGSGYLTPSSTSSLGADNTIWNSANGGNTDGFTLGAGTVTNSTNNSGTRYVAWNFRKQPKFFDIVTYTGNGSPRTISHNLGSTPGCIIVKRVSGSESGGISGYWCVYHRSMATPQSGVVFLNSTDGRNTTSIWNDTLPTSSVFSVNSNYTNSSGDQYIAYLFAHNAGGFGASGTDNIISCGAYYGTNNNYGDDQNLGFEPQWMLLKRVDNNGNAAVQNNWWITDRMRGNYYSASQYEGTANILWANTADAETGSTNRHPRFQNTGFRNLGQSYGTNQEATYIYVAIRRGVMKTPTDATKVFGINTYSGTGSAQNITTSIDEPALAFSQVRNASGWSSPVFYDALRGNVGLFTNQSGDEVASADYGAVVPGNTQKEAIVGMFGSSSGKTYVTWSFKRARGFFDVVCWTGDGSFDQVIPHNLGVLPEFVITKQRNYTSNQVLWRVRVNKNAGGTYNWRALYFGSTDYGSDQSSPYDTTSVAYMGVPLSTSGAGYVSYLFASCPGVSKIGSYTGNGSSQSINCGFTSGARFVLIKRFDTTGDWYVWDTSRGIGSGNDPHLSSNTYNQEVTSDDSLSSVSSGFGVIQNSTTNINVSSGNYIYLAIA